jgi:hypothetical protein
VGQYLVVCPTAHPSPACKLLVALVVFAGETGIVISEAKNFIQHHSPHRFCPIANSDCRERRRKTLQKTPFGNETW